MILKSALRATITEKMEEHEIDGRDFADDLVDALMQDFADNIHDDDDGEPDFLGDDE
jgi:hypothetical protein